MKAFLCHPAPKLSCALKGVYLHWPYTFLNCGWAKKRHFNRIWFKALTLDAFIVVTLFTIVCHIFAALLPFPQTADADKIKSYTQRMGIHLWLLPQAVSIIHHIEVQYFDIPTVHEVNIPQTLRPSTSHVQQSSLDWRGEITPLK